MPKQNRKGRGQGNKNTAARIEAFKRRAEALTLRSYGATYEAIAQRLGYADASGAWHAVEGGLHDVIEEPAKAVLKFELGRLDQMLVGCLPRAVTGHLGSIDRVIKIMDRRARYLGLDAPQKILVDDWREAAARAGLKASEEFEKMVAEIIASNAAGMGERTGSKSTGV